MHDKTQQEFLNELCPHLRPLIARVLECECGCQTLDFFRRRPLAWLEASDIAYHLHRPPNETTEILKRLTEAGVLERFTVLDSRTFYGLSQRHEILQALDQFWAWRDHWDAQLEQVKDALQLSAGSESALASH
jgi:DNA-binding IclR family transcriptional regulator